MKKENLVWMGVGILLTTGIGTILASGTWTTKGVNDTINADEWNELATYVQPCQSEGDSNCFLKSGEALVDWSCDNGRDVSTNQCNPPDPINWILNEPLDNSTGWLDTGQIPPSYISFDGETVVYNDSRNSIDDSHYSWIRKQYTGFPSDVMYYEVRLRFVALGTAVGATTNTGDFAFIDIFNGAMYRYTFNIGTDGVYFGDGQQITNYSFTTGVWYTLKLKLDKTNDSITLWVDGIEKGTITYVGSPSTVANYLMIGSLDEAAVYYDYLKVGE